MMLQVSSVEVVQELPGAEGWKFSDECETAGGKCDVMIVNAARHKCPRCWTYAAKAEDEVCQRCADVLQQQEN